MAAKKSIYFPGLNGLRFIAATFVIVSHIEELKRVFVPQTNQENFLKKEVFSMWGDLAVTFFFVLSGFLITYLLLAEKKETNTISLRNFYTRRILRIFPLYYLIVLLGFFVLPHFASLQFPAAYPEWSVATLHQHFWAKFALFFFFLANLARSLNPIPYVIHTWSIGVEEQFYLMWPFLMKYFKKTVRVMLFVIGAYLVIAKGIWYISDYIMPGHHILQVLSKFLLYTKIDCMAIGGLCAYIIFTQKQAFLTFIYQRWFQVLVYAGAVIPAFIGVSYGYFTHEVYGCLFGLMILNVSTNPKTIVNFEFPILHYLGKISYGIYMYHYLCVRLALIVVQKYIVGYGDLGTLGNLSLFIITIVMAIGLSALSYEFFESVFLRFKGRFTIIKSGAQKAQSKPVVAGAPETV